MIKLLQETGKFLYSTYGQYPALLFQGDNNFLNRCENLVVNHGLLHKGGIYSLPGNIRYILAPQERILQGLTEYFYGEIIMEKDANPIDYISEITDDETEEGESSINLSFSEPKVIELAAARAKLFWETKVEPSDILAKNYESFWSYSSTVYGSGKVRENSERGNNDSPEEIMELVDNQHSVSLEEKI